jgi:hypothetical protein
MERAELRCLPRVSRDWLGAARHSAATCRRVACPVIRSALGVSVTYAVATRAGRHRPHPRHWKALAQLVGVSGMYQRCGKPFPNVARRASRFGSPAFWIAEL